MTLILDIVKDGKNIASKRNFHFDNRGCSIGRNDSNDWVLTDPNSYISGQHANIVYRDGVYFIEDVSTNGTFLKNPYKKLPKGHPIKINTSDVFIIGDHELQARYSNNDYTESDIINTADENDIDDELIPNDDFIFNNKSTAFTSVETELSNDLDVEDMLDSSTIDIVPEESSNIIPDIDIADFLTNEDNPSEVEVEFETNEEAYEEHIIVPNYTNPEPEPKKEKVQEVHKNMKKDNSSLENSIKILESRLGLEISSLTPKERDRLMAELGDIINITLGSLKNSLEIKDKIKEDLNLSTIHIDTNSSNPIKLGTSAIKLLQNKESSAMLGMMNISEAIKKSFKEIDIHSISLYNSSKSVANIALSKFSPKNLEYKFEANGMLRGVMPKQQLLWRAYVDMFKGLNENPEDGVSMIRDDFKKEYEKIAYSLKLQTHETRQGI
jgi:type VI secretion system FHA domain protein